MSTEYTEYTALVLVTF